MDPPPKSVALIAGVTGMVGRSLVAALKSPSARNGPWTVYGVARHPPGPTTPIPGLDRFIQLDTLNRSATNRTLTPLATNITHLFWVALGADDDVVDAPGTNVAMLDNVVSALTGPVGSKLRHCAVQTGSKHYYFGYLVEPDRAGPVQVPFKEDSPRPDFRIFYYDLEDLLKNFEEKLMLTWSVHRSSLIFGASDRSFYNILLTLSVAALICRHEGTSLAYPGTEYTWNHFCDASDADILAEQQIWAATTPEAKNQAFNCTNGDIFTWKSMWIVIGDVFDVPVIGPTPNDDTGYEGWLKMKRKGEEAWEKIVKENGLVVTKLEEITCFDAIELLTNFKFQHVSCMNKSREFGFNKSVDTLKSVRKWVERLVEMRMIPRVGGSSSFLGEKSKM